METKPKITQMLELANNDFKADFITMIKGIKKNSNYIRSQMKIPNIQNLKITEYDRRVIGLGKRSIEINHLKERRKMRRNTEWKVTREKIFLKYKTNK